MSNTNKVKRMLGRGAASAFAFAMVAIGTWAQDTSTTTVQHGAPSFETQVRNAEVIYVEGNDLVLKLESGKVEHLVVPDSDKFTIDGQEVSVHELVRGTKLTQSITTSTTPRYVNTVRTIEGQVWHVNTPKSVIVRLPDNSHQIYTVPNHAKFIVNGQPKTVFDLRKGMKIKATIVTDDTHTVIEQSKAVTGEAPIPQALPREVGVLLFLAAAQPEAPVAAEQTEIASTLPKAASLLPLAGLLGVLAVVLSLGLAMVRQTFKG
jgi:hypothetical protein